VPRVAALMSAFGMFAKDLGLEYARSCARRQKKLDFAEVNALYTDMHGEALRDFARIGFAEAALSFQPTVEMRYADQFHEVEVDLPSETLNAETLAGLLANFHAKYKSMYTYSMPWREAEFLTFRLKVTAPRRPVKMAVEAKARTGVEAARRGSRTCLFQGSSERVDTPVYDWDRLAPGHRVNGPALLDDRTTTVLVLPGFTCEVDAYRNLVLRAK
jgi:N-methylhydantoinase A